MKEKIAVALAVLLIGMSVSACSRNTADDNNANNGNNTSSTTNQNLPGDNDDGMKDNSSLFSDIESDVESDRDSVSSFISSTASEMK